MVLAKNPEAAIASKPWDNQRRPPDVYKNPPPDELRKEGWRLKWADEIRLLVEVDGKTYERVHEVIKWLQYDDKTGFVVESPKALRAKWPAIHRQMIGRPASKSGQPDNSGVDRAVEKLESALMQGMAPVSADATDEDDP